jgi:serine phosphatase RsbU (regulator of sigma subunit)
LLLAVFPRLGAQEFNLTANTEPLADLSKATWRFHAGNNPGWADPALDDSSWPLLAADRSWNEQGFKDLNGIAWYRIRVKLPANQPIFIAPGNVLDSYQLFANGREVGHWGSIPGTPVPPPLHGVWSMVAQAPAHSGDLLIALRVWHRRPLSNSFNQGFGGFSGDSMLIGSPAAVRQAVSLQREHRMVWLAASFVLPFLYLLVAGLSLVLFAKQPASRSYLWFSVLLICFVMVQLPNAVGEIWLTSINFDPLNDVFAALGHIALILFFYSFVGRPVGRFARWLIIAQIPLLTIDLFVTRRFDVGIFAWNLVYEVIDAVVYLTATVLVFRYWKQLRAARRLAFPVILLGITAAVDNVDFILASAGVIDLGIPDLLTQPFYLSYEDLSQLLFVLTMGYILAERFAESEGERTQLFNEFEAARQVQHLLIPITPPDTPGFIVESAYLPAQQVGGDFFLVLPATRAGDHSLLVVVGDVSGKGLKAAMVVSTIMGALRGMSLRSPGEVLSYLNTVLLGHFTGFATCCAALVQHDGRVQIANAGNPAPYCGGQELHVSSGLPLGVLGNMVYEETVSQLSIGDRLTFVSDGVVEATNPDTRELFGFDRSREISREPASKISQTAVAFGLNEPQADDITVLTVQRIPHSPQPGV